MKNSEKKKIKNDLILAISILALVLLVFVIFKLTAKAGSTVYITLDGEEYASLPLNEDTELEICSGENGEYKNTVKISGGKVTVSYSNCPDKICSKHRAIKNTGESITCLPHKLVITVKGQSTADDVDISTK